MVGCIKAGVVPIPCIEMLPAGDVDYRVRNAEAKGAITTRANTGKFAAFADLPCRIAVGGDDDDADDGWIGYADAISGASMAFEPVRTRAEDPAIMYYTSGSTGSPRSEEHTSELQSLMRISYAV